MVEVAYNARHPLALHFCLEKTHMYYEHLNGHFIWYSMTCIFNDVWFVEYMSFIQRRTCKYFDKVFITLSTQGSLWVDTMLAGQINVCWWKSCKSQSVWWSHFTFMWPSIHENLSPGLIDSPNGCLRPSNRYVDLAQTGINLHGITWFQLSQTNIPKGEMGFRKRWTPSLIPSQPSKPPPVQKERTAKCIMYSTNFWAEACHTGYRYLVGCIIFSDALIYRSSFTGYQYLV